MGTDAVKIYTAQDNIQAGMILGALENSEIPAYKKDLGSAGLMNLYSGISKCGSEIYVAEENRERAMEVIRGMGLE